MSKIRQILTMALLLVSTALWAQKVDALIVTSGDGEQQFAISDVKEVVFGDEGMTVVRTDETRVEFAAGWQMRFGEVEIEDGIGSVGDDSKGKAQLFNAEGKLLREQWLHELRIGELPKGVYIVKCGGVTFKITR